MNLAPQLAFINIQTFDKEKLKQFFKDNLFYNNINFLKNKLKEFSSSEFDEILFNFDGGIGISISDIKYDFDENIEYNNCNTNVIGFKFKSNKIESSFLKIKDKINNSQLRIYFNPFNTKHYSFLLNNLMFQFFHEENDFFLKSDNLSSGIFGIIIRVENTEKALEFYRNILMYDKILFQEESIFSDFEFLQFENIKIIRTVISQSQTQDITHNNFFGNSTIELIEIVDKNYQNNSNFNKYKFHFFAEDYSEIMLKIQKLNYNFQIEDNKDTLKIYDFYENDIYIHKLTKQKLTTFFQEAKIFFKSI